jgi:arginyl-tRNA synthetase
MLLQQISELARQALSQSLQIRAQRIPVEFPADRSHGDLTINAFLIAKEVHAAPNLIAEELARALSGLGPIESAAAVRGFVNLRLATEVVFLGSIPLAIGDIRQFAANREMKGLRLMVEYSAPNTNKPLHLGHMRNNFLGHALSLILQNAGAQVIKANLYNDRGTHICKSMLAYKKFGEGRTPESEGIKGDHFVGRYYVLFERRFAEQVVEFIESNPRDFGEWKQQHGVDRKGRPLSDNELITAYRASFREESFERIPLGAECQDMLRAWEKGEEEVVALWTRMNAWAIAGFEQTYKDQGVSFDVVYRESETYAFGKEIIAKGLERQVFYRRPDGAIEIDLTADKLDKKVVLRSDGTSVYMTQDIGTTVQKAEEHKLDGQVWVVGNEQRYHFQVLFKILERLGYTWADRLHHLAYGMVNLPDGKMKSREGRVVDSDDLLKDVVALAAQEIRERDHAGDLNPADIAERAQAIGLASLRFMLLKVSPMNDMVFNPEESVSFEGDTGARVLYAYARLKSMILDDPEATATDEPDFTLLQDPAERFLALDLLGLAGAAARAAREYNPGAVANYLLDLVRDLNRFYDRCPVLKEPNRDLRRARLALCKATAEVLARGAELLGMPLLQRM